MKIIWNLPCRNFLLLNLMIIRKKITAIKKTKENL